MEVGMKQLMMMKKEGGGVLCFDVDVLHPIPFPVPCHSLVCARCVVCSVWGRGMKLCVRVRAGIEGC